MAEEHLSLKWNNHQAHFVDILTFLREKGMFVDVTLACGGKVYSAHKFVLSTCSDYFQKIFSKNTSANPVVFMKDVSCNDIEALLDFMYHGEVNVPQSSLGSLIKTAEGLQIKGLAVPDDPPSRKKQDRDKRERDPSSSSHYESRSPPPKRRSRNSPPRRNSARAIPPPVETYLDNNDADDVTLRNSPPTTNSHDARSSSDAPSTNKKSHITNDSSEDHSSDGKGVCDKELSGDSNNETPQPPNCDGGAEQDDAAGPSGLRQSKQEEMEIKQEDVVELGEDDDDGVDWGGGMGDDGGGGGGNNDGLNSGDNSVSFSDVLLPPPDQGGGGGSGMMDGAGSGDSAMRWRASASSEAPHHSNTMQEMLLRQFDQARSRCPQNLEANQEHLQSSDLWPSIGFASEATVSTQELRPTSTSASNLNFLNLMMGSASRCDDVLASAPSDAHDPQSSLGTGGFVCEVCGKHFMIRYYYMRHLMSHQEKRFLCPYCPVRVCYKWNLKAHVSKRHKDKPPLY